MDPHVRNEFWEAFAESPFCMVKLDNASGHAEPMTAQLDKDASHAFWLYTTRTNRIAPGGKAMIQFQSKGHDVFACLAGTLVEEMDRERFEQHWSNVTEAWFPEGKRDPGVVMMRFDIADAEVWTADMTIKGKFKLLTGMEIRPEEAGEYAEGMV